MVNEARKRNDRDNGKRKRTGGSTEQNNDQTQVVETHQTSKSAQLGSTSNVQQCTILFYWGVHTHQTSTGALLGSSA